MKELNIGDRVELVDNKASSRNGVGFIGYVVYKKSFATPQHASQYFTEEEIDSGFAHHYWIERDFNPKEGEPWSGKWSFRKDLKRCSIVNLNEYTNVI